MSLTIATSGQLVVTNGTLRNIASLTYSLPCTGSNSISDSVNVATGSWMVLNQSSNADFRFGFFQNADLTSSVQIAVDSTASNAAYLYPGDYCVLTNSGSHVIYVAATGAHSPAVLQYVISEM